MALDFSHGLGREDQGAAAAAPYLSIYSVGRRCRGAHGGHRPALQHAPLSVAALRERRKKSEGRRGYRPPQLLLQEMSKLQGAEQCSALRPTENVILRAKISGLLRVREAAFPLKEVMGYLPTCAVFKGNSRIPVFLNESNRLQTNYLIPVFTLTQIWG